MGINKGKSQPSANRADEIRRKRTERSQDRLNMVSGRVSHPVQPRPVVTRGSGKQSLRQQNMLRQEANPQAWPWQRSAQRGSTASMPIYRQASTRARRQFYLTMDRTSGTELRLPALPSFQIGWRLLSGLIVILVSIVLYSLWSSPFLQVSGVEVIGLQRLTPAEVNKTLQLEDVSIIEVDAGEVQKKLVDTYPELTSVQVSVELPNIVTVTAAERIPVMAIKKGNKVTWVDADGTLFPARGKASKLITIFSDDALPLAPLPVDPAVDATATAEAQSGQVKASQEIPVTGPRRVTPSLMAAAEELHNKLPADTQLVYTKQNGLGWKDPQGWQVFVGKDLSDFEEKYAMYQSIASKLAKEGVTPVLVSVENPDAPYYRLEQ